MKTLSQAAIAAVLVLLTQPVNADVVWNISDNGTDLKVVAIGTLDLSGVTTTKTDNRSHDRVRSFGGGIVDVWSFGGDLYWETGLGTLSGANLGPGFGIEQTPGNGTGTSFGIIGDRVYWDHAFGATPGEISINRSYMIANKTVSDLGMILSSSSSPIVVWTHDTTGETVSLFNANSLVPEPSSSLLMGMGLLFGACRRRSRG